MPKIRITTCVTEDIVNSLSNAAKIKERSKSFIISKAIEKYTREIQEEFDFNEQKSA